jgi:BASS family bile acid:Na+ symporter
MLPGALVLGISSYLVYHLTPELRPIGPACHAIASFGQRWLIAVLLFFQFVQVSPHDLKPVRWHWWALLVQVASFAACAAGVALARSVNVRIPLECAMLCLICPTASAAGVITGRLGGSIADTVTYLVMMNVVATFLIPLVIPLVNPAPDMAFWAYVGSIALKIFPVLILPSLLAWIIRYTTHKLQRKLMRWAPNAFYVWGVSLTLAMVLATRAMLLSQLGAWTIVLIVLVSLAACALQFFVGRHLVRKDPVTPGQALGQKNTGFLIWLGYTYLTPVTSVAGGLYAVWQNLFNSWELQRKK